MSRTVTIIGNALFKDGSPISGARIRIWEMDKKSADDLIVNDTTDRNGRFSGSGVWKDGGIIDTPTYRYEITFDGKRKTGKNILDKKFFKKLQTGWKSPAQVREEQRKAEEKERKAEERKENHEEIEISGRVLWNDRTPAPRVHIKVWETDNFRRDSDDLIVDTKTDANGDFSGKGFGKDDKLFQKTQTFRWKVSVPELNYEEESWNKELLKSDLKFIRLKEKLKSWENWIDDFGTIIGNRFFMEPKNLKELKANIQFALDNEKKIKVVGSGHSHSKVAKPYDFNAVISTDKLRGKLKKYPWLKKDVLTGLQEGSLPNEPDFVKSYVRVKSGTPLRTIFSKILAKEDLGLINIGPFDAQKIGGLVNTNTHGTGINLPGFTDMVRSVEMFVIVPQEDGSDKVELWVIEPTAGISDPNQFRRLNDGRYLVQNDDVFYSVVCGYGLFGVAYSYTLAVRDLYWMKEESEPMLWGELETILDNLTETNHPPKLSGTYSSDLYNPDTQQVERNIIKNKQVKLYINTAEVVNGGGITNNTNVRVDTWKEVFRDYKPDTHDDSIKDIHKIWPPMKERECALVFVIRKLSDQLSNPSGLRNKPNPLVLELLRAQFFNKKGVEPFLNKYSESAYYRSIRRGRDNTLKYDKSLPKSIAKFDNTEYERDPIPQDYGPSIEICVPIEHTKDAIEKFMNKIADTGLKFIAPVGVRFVASSDHFLSPTQGRTSTYIELAGVLPSRDMFDVRPTHANEDYESFKRRVWPDFMKEYNKAFRKIFDGLAQEIPGIRFHKGKFNRYHRKLLSVHYPDTFNKWHSMYRLFSSSGFIDCPVTEKWQLQSGGTNVSRAQLGRQLDALKTV